MENAARTNERDKRNSLGLLKGLLFGMLAGFGVTMLHAPQSKKDPFPDWAGKHETARPGY